MKRSFPVAKASYVTKKSENGVIRSLMDFLRLQSRLEAKNGKPTYAHFLGLSASPVIMNNDGVFDDDDDPSFVQENQFSFLEKSNTDEQKKEPPSLVFRYRFPSNDRLRYLFEDPHYYEDEQSRAGIKPQQQQQQQQQQHLRHRHRRHNLSTYMSIMDEVTTFGLISATPQHPRPGVSVTIQSQWGPHKVGSSSSSSSSVETAMDSDNDDNDASSSMILGEEVDIVTTITKMGRNLGFVRAEVRDPSTGGVICFFDQVKYLPPGWLFSIILTPIGRWFIDNIYLRYNNNVHHKRSVIASTQNTNNDHSNDDNNNGNDYSGITDSFHITSDTTASFRFGPQHTNGFGGLHGGFQAILMERLGQVVARNEFLQLFNTTSSSSSSSTTTDDPSGDDAINYHNNNVGVDLDVECERMQVSYQSSASTRRLELCAYVIDPPRLDRPSITLRIEILRHSKQPKDNSSHRKSVVVSEGILTFVEKTSYSKTLKNKQCINTEQDK